MKNSKFKGRLQFKPQQPQQKRPMPRVVPVCLGDVMRRAARRARATAAIIPGN